VGGAVAYSNELKTLFAAVPAALLEEHGAVSKEAAAAMAEAAAEKFGADVGIATTGVAGPTEQEGRPVGTVFVAVAGPGGGEVRRLQLPGERAQVRALSVTYALDLLRRHLVGKT
jgi:PncC family amidohydrolase